jgi:general secretion pathway protein H
MAALSATCDGRASARRRHAAGMSLLELVLVVALVAVAGLLVAAVYGGALDGVRLRGSAKEIAAQLRHTRAQAIAGGRAQRFEIDPVARRWQAPRGRSGRVPESVDVQFTGARELQPAAGRGAIVFFEDGGSSGGRVQLRSGAATWRIEVSWLTGEVTLSRVAAP